MKKHKVAINSMATKARGKNDMHRCEINNFKKCCDVCLTKFEIPILLNKFSHIFQLTTKLLAGLKTIILLNKFSHRFILTTKLFIGLKAHILLNEFSHGYLLTANVCREIGSLLSFSDIFGWVARQCC